MKYTPLKKQQKECIIPVSRDLIYANLYWRTIPLDSLTKGPKECFLHLNISNQNKA